MNLQSGKVFTNPNNFRAFQNQKAWKIEEVEMGTNGGLDVGFQIEKEADRRTMEDQGLWSFSNTLLVLRRWKPSTPGPPL